MLSFENVFILIKIFDILSKTISEISKHFCETIMIENNYFMVTCMCVRGSTLACLAIFLVLLSLGNTSARRVINRRAGVFVMESITKTISKRAKLGPRTELQSTMQMLFWIVIASKKCLLIIIIDTDNVSKIWIELMK